MKPYQTVGRFGQAEIIINKSRFIGACARCESEQEALAFLAARREAHREATHNCYAYIVGITASTMRYSDDGEPSGTAGLPILEVLRAKSLTNCAVVITRYFGGILLGAGGLVRAYARACADAVASARVVTMRPLKTFLLELPYSLLDRFLNDAKGRPLRIDEREFSGSVVLTLTLPAEYEADFFIYIADLTSGGSEPLLIGEGYGEWVDSE